MARKPAHNPILPTRELSPLPSHSDLSEGYFMLKSMGGESGEDGGLTRPSIGKQRGRPS